MPRLLEAGGSGTEGGGGVSIWSFLSVAGLLLLMVLADSETARAVYLFALLWQLEHS